MKLSCNIVGLKLELPTNMLLAVLSMVLVSMILITSQSESAFAGSCPDDGEDNDGDGYCTTTGDCDDSDPDVNPEQGCIGVVDFEHLKEDVEYLIDDESIDINIGEAIILLKTLERSLGNFLSGDIQGTITQLTIFANMINAFTNNGNIPDNNDGETLIDEAEKIIDSLEQIT